MSIFERWKAPTPQFFKKIVKGSLIVSAGAAALLMADPLGKAIIPSFSFTLVSWVVVVCKNLVVTGLVVAAVAKAAKIDSDKTEANQ